MLDIPFEIAETREVEERYPDGMPKEEVPEYLSRLKAEAYRDFLKEGDILITADTVVLLEGEIIGKPRSPEDAKTMLSKLSGKVHRVITGVSLTSQNKSESFSVKTDVKFAPLTSEEINYYVNKYRPLDKAGAYGIQEWIGLVGIEKIEGDFYNVMGLPVHRLIEKLTEIPEERFQKL